MSVEKQDKPLNQGVKINPLLEDVIKSLEKIDFKEKAFEGYRNLKNKYHELKSQLPLKEDKESIKKEMGNLKKKRGNFKLEKKHYLIITIEEVLNTAKKMNLGLCQLNDSLYLYNERYWEKLDSGVLKIFLSKAAGKLGVDKFDADFFRFTDDLVKQFLSKAYLPKPQPKEGVVLINLGNGTFHISKEKRELKAFAASDYLMYQLPFDYDEKVTAPLFQNYLDEVQPDKDVQDILSEFLGYLFLPHLKLEKALILYGSGANGKSVFFEIVSKLLGEENISNFALSSLTNENGYYRAQFANKLLNYASEINGKLEVSKFKQMVSGEPIEARTPYGKPFILKQYGRFIFNSNELPKEVEYTNAFFRRFLIVPFNIQIPPEKQDKGLPKRITDKELSGIFNWVLKGLERLQINQGFTKSEVVEAQLKTYQEGADNVKQFLKDEGFHISTSQYIKLQELYSHYRKYCKDSGYKFINKKSMRERLERLSVVIERKNVGNVVYLEKQQQQQQQQPNISIANTA